MRKLITIALLFFSLSGFSQLQMMFTADSIFGITSPAAIDSLTLWYEADYLCLDSTGGAIGNNEGVATWTDRSGNSLNATCTNNGARAVWKSSGGPGNYPYLQFDGSNDSLGIALTALLRNSNDVHVFVVGNYGGTLTNNETIYHYSNNAAGLGAGIRMRCISASSSNQFQVYNGAAVSANDATVSTSTWHLFTGFYDNSVASSQVDNGAATTTAGAGNITYTGATTHRIGASNVLFTGSITALIVYRKDLSAAESSAIQNYLNKKYNIY